MSSISEFLILHATPQATETVTECDVIPACELVPAFKIVLFLLAIVSYTGFVLWWLNYD